MTRCCEFVSLSVSSSLLELFSIFQPSPGLSGFDSQSSPLLPETPQISALMSKRISACEMLSNRSRLHRLPHILASSDSCASEPLFSTHCTFFLCSCSLFYVSCLPLTFCSHHSLFALGLGLIYAHEEPRADDGG